MTLYASLNIGGGENAGSVAQTTTAQFTGSVFNTTAANNQVELSQISIFSGSVFSTSGTDFTGSFYNTTKSGGGIINTSSPGSAAVNLYDGSKDNSNNFGGNDRMAEGIPCIFTGSVRGVELYCSKGNSYNITGNMINVGIATSVSGAFIADVWFNGDNLPTFATGQSYQAMTFTTVAPLISGTLYYLRWDTSGQLGHASDQWRWTYDSTAPSYAGSWWTSTDSGAWVSAAVDEDFKIYQDSGAGVFVTVGSYMQTFAVAGSYWNVGSLVWHATSGADQTVQAQYSTCASGGAFGAFSAFTAGSVVVINESNIGSVNMMFLVSGTTSSSPVFDDLLLDYNGYATYQTNGSYLATLDLSGTTAEDKKVNGIVWHSGGTGPISVDYRFSNDLVAFTSFINDTTGSVVLSNQTYRYAQLRFNLSGNGTAL